MVFFFTFDTEGELSQRGADRLAQEVQCSVELGEVPALPACPCIRTPAPVRFADKASPQRFAPAQIRTGAHQHSPSLRADTDSHTRDHGHRVRAEKPLPLSNQFLNSICAPTRVGVAHHDPLLNASAYPSSRPGVCRYSAGGTLSAYIQNNPLTEDKALYLFLQIASAIEFCHSKARPPHRRTSDEKAQTPLIASTTRG